MTQGTRHAPVQLSWERNLQMAPTFPTTSPGTAQYYYCPIYPLLTNTTTKCYCPIYLLLPTTTKYYHPIYPLPATTLIPEDYSVPSKPNIPTVSTDATALNQGRDMLKQNVLYQALTTQSTHSEEPVVEVVLFEQPSPNGPEG